MPLYSHSRLEMYQNCPLKYKFQYIEHLPKTQGVEAFLGSRVHDVLEKLYRDLLNGKRNTREELLDFYNQQWERNWDQETIKIVRKQYAPDHYYKAGWLCIDSYYNRYHPFDGDTTLGVEVRVDFHLNHKDRYHMMGFIDRLARGHDGVWEIHDYKTSGALPSQNDIDERPQLALYQIGVRQKWPQIKEIRLVWHFLRFDTALSTTWTASRLDDLGQKTMRLIDTIDADRDLHPRESALCNWCDFQDKCPLKKHPLKTSILPPQEFRADEGVRLVNEYVSLKGQEQEIKALIERAKERLVGYARQEGVKVISGSHQSAAVYLKKKFKIPGSGDARRKELEDLIRQAGKWSEISSLNSVILNKILRERSWDGDLLEKIMDFSTEEEEAQVRLRQKHEEK